MRSRHSANCQYCGKKFFGKKKSKFCSQSCGAKNRIPVLIQRNIDRRKYPSIQGFNRGQIYRFYNPSKDEKSNLGDRQKRLIIIDYLGGKCCKCGYCQDDRALQLDHILGDGHLDRKRKGRGKIYRYYVKNLDECKKSLQILCANCNKIKQLESREFLKSKKIRINQKIQKMLENQPA